MAAPKFINKNIRNEKEARRKMSCHFREKAPVKQRSTELRVEKPGAETAAGLCEATRKQLPGDRLVRKRKRRKGELIKYAHQTRATVQEKAALSKNEEARQVA